MSVGMFLMCVLCTAATVFGQDTVSDCSDYNTTLLLPRTAYKCANGSMVPIGCKLEDGQTVNDGQTFKLDGRLLQCQRVGKEADAFEMVLIACVVKDRIVAPSQSYVEGVAWFVCESNRRSPLVLQLVGCVGPDDEKVKFNETLVRGNYVYKCNRNEGDQPNIELTPFGCLYNGKQYLINETISLGQFWYKCEILGKDNIQIKLRGCLDDSGLLEPGDVFHSHGFLFKCDKTENGLRRVGLGCLEITAQKSVIEHSFGERWTEGKLTTKYVVECSQDSNGVAKVPVQCAFPSQNSEEPAMIMNPGCIARRAGSLLQCIKTERGGLRSVVNEISTPTDEAKAILAGFKYC